MSVLTLLVAIVGTGVAVGLTLLASWRSRPALAVPAAVPLVVGVIVRAGGIDVPTPGRGWDVVLAATVLALGVTGGGPFAEWLIARAGSPNLSAGAVRSNPQVLRGGATIGYLERVAVVGAAGLGRFEIVAAVIAVKGLGRFRELDTSAAREQFIIGTLASLIWAGTCGALVFAGGG